MGVHLWFLMNLRFTAWPEMLAYPYLFGKGFTLYRDFIYPYTPLLTVVLGWVYRVFGYEVYAMRGVAYLLLGINDLLIFLVIRELTKSVVSAVFGVAVYVAVQPFLEGNMMWFDVAVVTPLLGALYFLIGRKYFWSGVSLAVAAMIKQTAGMYLVLGLIYLVFRERGLESLLRFLVGPVVMGGVLLVWLVGGGLLGDFLNWTLIYPFLYWSKFPGYVQMELVGREISFLLVLMLPLVLLLRRSGERRDKILVLIFILLGLVSVYPRWSFFHFQSALAFLAVAYGFVFGSSRKVMVAFAVAVLGMVMFRSRNLEFNFGQEARFYGHADNELALKIRSEVAVDEGVYLLGVQSSLYSMADLLPPKPWMDNFGWYLEIPGVQEEIIARWETNSPGVIVWREPGEGNWFDLGVYQPVEIKDWIENNYNKEGEIEEGVWIWRRS